MEDNEVRKELAEMQGGAFLPGYSCRAVVSPISEEAVAGGSPTFDLMPAAMARSNLGGGEDAPSEYSGLDTSGSRTSEGSHSASVDSPNGWSPVARSSSQKNVLSGSMDEGKPRQSCSPVKEGGDEGSSSGSGPYKPRPQTRPYSFQQGGAGQAAAGRGQSGGQAKVQANFNPSVPAFNPGAPAFDHHTAAFKQPTRQGYGQKVPSALHRPHVGHMAGDAKSRLPVFSQLQTMDSGSDRGSSRRSDRSSPTNSIDSLTNSIDSMHTDGTVAPRMLIRELTQKMCSKDESKAAAAAKKVFDIVRESCPTWRQNQTEICRSPEMLISLAGLLRAGSERCRYEACRALGNIAFQNPGTLGQALPADVMKASGAADALATDICYTIVSSVGMMDGLKYVLRTGTCNSKHEAARVINNCAAYSPAAAELIVNCEGLVEGLKALCGQAGRAQRTRAKAVGAINCLSTYEAVRPVLLKQKVVEEALLPALAQRKKTFGDGDEFKAMRADAVMASANLVGKQEFSVLVSEPDAFKTVMKCLRYGVEGQVWAGVTWTAYSALLPLSNLTVSDANKPKLAELGLVSLLYRVLNECVSKGESELALECLDNLVFAEDCRREMAKSNATLIKAVRVHGVGEEGHKMARRSQRIMWLLANKSNAPELRLLQHQHPLTHGRHIYISYDPYQTRTQRREEDEQDEEPLPERVRLMKEALEETGFRVCCKAAGGDLDEMAEAVSVCSFFVLCATRRYKECAACRFEAQFAEDARKPILPVSFEGEIDRHFGWLNVLVKGKKVVDFSGPAPEGAPPAAKVVVGVAVQWLGTPPPPPPKKKDKKEKKEASPQTSPSLLPQPPPKAHVGGPGSGSNLMDSRGSVSDSRGSMSDSRGSIANSPQIRPQGGQGGKPSIVQGLHSPASRPQQASPSMRSQSAQQAGMQSPSLRGMQSPSVPQPQQQSMQSGMHTSPHSLSGVSPQHALAGASPQSKSKSNVTQHQPRDGAWA